jgi:predicted DNA binding protein
VTTRLNCELTFERQVPVDGDGCLQYLTVEGTDPSAVCEHLLDSPAVDRCAVVREGTDRSGLLEVRIGDGAESVIGVLISHGASITTAHAVDGEVNVTAEVAPEADVRDLLEDLEEVASKVELVSKRPIDRPVPAVPAVEQLVRNELTTKQEAALAAAYTRGYYAWPRGSTAEEIAQTMDIASSTLHYHLRHALQNLLTAFFEPDRLGR